MLVWDDVVFVFGVYGLEVRRDVDVFRGELGGGEIGELLEQVGVVRRVHVEVGCC